MPSSNIGLPGLPQGPIAGKDGTPTSLWVQFFLTLWNRTGQNTGSPSLIIDNISDVPGALLYRNASAWVGLGPAAQYKALRMGAAFPEWDTLDGNSFGAQPKANFFLAPTAAAGIPAFRALVSTDLAAIAGQLPGTVTNDNAAVGNVGEYLSSQIAPGAAVPVTSGNPFDITTLSLEPGDWDVWGNIGSAPDVTTTTSQVRGWIGTVSATDPGAPNQGAYALSQSGVGAGLGTVLPVGTIRITVPAGPNLTVYLSTVMGFATSTMGAFGFLGARRAR